ncbi:MAG: hypothetical protein KKA81_13380 [Bacteroidetes bacterium]|nr:hypothetical protein [Bacteroidota bacterium]
MDLSVLLPDSGRATAESVAGLVLDNPVFFEEIYNACYSSKGKIPMRASRVIEICSVRDPDRVKSYLHDIIRRLPGLTDESVKRNFLKTLLNYPVDYEEDLLGLLVDYCFGRLHDIGEPVAVRAYAMTLLYEITLLVPELTDELRESILLYFDSGSAGYQARGIEILKRIDTANNDYKTGRNTDT